MLTILLSLYAVSLFGGINVPTVPIPLWKDHSLVDTSLFPKKDAHHIAPILGAKSVLAVDLETGFPLFEKASHEQLAIASLTKLMTIILILEENKLDEVVKIPQEISK